MCQHYPLQLSTSFTAMPALRQALITSKESEPPTGGPGLATCTKQAAEEHRQQLQSCSAMRHTLSDLAHSAEAAICSGPSTAAAKSRSASQEELAGLNALSEGRHMLGSAIIAMEVRCCGLARPPGLM